MGVEQAALTNPNAVPLEQRFGNYAAQAHPESVEPEPNPVPRETPAETPVVAETPAETPVETPAETPAEEPVHFEFETVDELAKRLEVPVEAILGLKLKTKVDEQEGEYSLADIQKGFQLDKHNQNKSKELSALQQKAEQTRLQYEALNQATTQHSQNLQTLGRYAQEMLNIDVDAFNKSPEIQQLRYTDPSRYMIAKDDLQMRQNQINAFVTQVNQQSQQQLAQAEQRRQAQLSEVVNNRASIKPEWADEGTFRKDAETIRDTFLAHGFKAEELPTLLTNPAYLAAADAATRWWNLQKQKPEVTAQVRTAPKTIKGSARLSAVKSSALTNSKAQVRANPKDQDIAGNAFAEWATEASKAGLL